MIAVLLFAALLQAAPAFGDEAARDAIWSDLFNSAFLHSGGVSQSWLFGRDKDRPPTVRIRQLRCRPYFSAHRCTFALERTPDPAASVEDRREASMLKCDTRLVANEAGMQPAWKVPHRPLEPQDEHSLTTMSCRVARAR